MRHINVKSLWLQEKELQKVLEYVKVKGEENPADGLTKHVRQELAARYSTAVHLRLGGDRAKSSLPPSYVEPGPESLVRIHHLVQVRSDLQEIVDGEDSHASVAAADGGPAGEEGGHC